jgi:hypothetical protein
MPGRRHGSRAGYCIIAAVNAPNASIRPGDLPAHALLARYRGQGAYTDCLIVELPRRVSQAAYVEAFFTSPLFGVERALLAAFARRPSTHEQARRLASASGDASDFAAWTVEARGERQLLLRDVSGRTRTWLMSEPAGDSATRLYFGSAMLPRGLDAAGRPRMGAAFRALLGFHAIYSRALLHAAKRRLMRGAHEAPSARHDAAPSARHDAAQPDGPARHSPERAAVAPGTVPAASRRRGGPPWRRRPTPEQIAAMPVFEALPLERITLVETPAQCEAALRALERARFVGFDTESKPTFTRDAVNEGPHVIQLATAEQAFIVQVNDRTPIAFLRAVLDSEAIVKVGFGLVSDRAPLERKLGLRLRGTVEVAQVLRSLGFKDDLGAKAAVAVVLGRRLQKSKSIQTSNWGAATLTPQQIRYAGNDAYAALKVFEAMGSPSPETR